MEDVLDFKEVHDNRKVPLVATKYKGRADAWWQQVKAKSSPLREVKDQQLGEIVETHEGGIHTPYLCEEDVSEASESQARNTLCG